MLILIQNLQKDHTPPKVLRELSELVFMAAPVGYSAV